MRAYSRSLFVCLLLGPLFATGQSTGFDSFISRLTTQYHVDVAIAPELIPTLDSIRHAGAGIRTVDELLNRLLRQTGITYQIVDDNKLMLRRESTDKPIHIAGVVEGRIKDRQTGMPLSFATVYATASGAACHTDDDGRFLLPVGDTSGMIQIHYLGYRTMERPVHEFLNGGADLAMDISQIPLAEIIVIVPYKLMDQNYDQQSTDLRGYQLISEDQLLSWNAEQLLTSLTAYTHFSSDQGIRIRGRDAGNSLILMDAIPVYDPYHFYNIFSPFNGHYFSSVEVYKNNLPVEYGGRIDGMIHAQSVREQPQSRLILDTDLLMTSLTSEVVLSPKAYFTAAGRFSHTGVIRKGLSDSTAANFSLPGRFNNENEWSTTQQPETDFYDVNLGLAVQAGKKNQLSLNYFHSQDRLDNVAITDFTTSIFNQEIISVDQSYTSEDDWRNSGFSASWKTQFSDQLALHITGFHAGYEKSSAYTSRLEETRLGITRTLTGSGYYSSNLVSSGVKAYVQQTQKGRSSYTAGIEIQGHDVSLQARENFKSFLTQEQNETELSAFGEYGDRIGRRLQWSLGSRLTHLASTEKIYALPNLRLHYDIDERWSIRSAYSKNLQALHAITFENRFGRELDYLVLSEPLEKYPVLTSDKIMLGAGYHASQLGIDIEAYYKSMDGLTRVRPLQPDPSYEGQPGLDDFYRLFTGDGWTAGVDLTVLYKAKKFETSMLYTLSKFQERYEGLFKGEHFSPQEDRRHQLKLTTTHKLGRFQISSLLNFKSKAPYLSFVRLEGGDGIGQVDQSSVQRYLPAYFSLDLGLDFIFRLFRQPSMVGVSLINATNHENINDLQHIGRITRENGQGLFLTSQTELLERTFNVHLKVLID